jgi:F-type H+-transporting ATPase subunit delta
MSSRAAASRYARALFDVADPAGRGGIDEELTSVARLFAEQTDLQAVFASPSVPPNVKLGIVQTVVQRAGVSQPVAKLLTLLAERDRLGILSDVAALFHERMLDEENVLQAEVTTATPLGAAEQQALQARLSAATSKQVTITARVDPAIIGGIVTRIGSTVYDGSLANQLARIRERLSASR